MNEFKDIGDTPKGDIDRPSERENLGKFNPEISIETDLMSFFRRSIIPTYGFVDDKHKDYYDLLKGKIGDLNKPEILGHDKEGLVIGFKTKKDEDVPKSGNYLEDYLKANLSDYFPEASELEKQLGENMQFYIWVRRHEQPIFIVERSDGTKSVFRLVYSTSRSIEEASQDIPKRPSVIPNFSLVSFGEGRIGALIDFINGHAPRTEVEKQLCKDKSQELLNVPMLEYDISDINFIIEERTGNPYYIDRDIVEGIIRNGLSTETAESRRPLLTEGARRMDQF